MGTTTSNTTINRCVNEFAAAGILNSSCVAKTVFTATQIIEQTCNASLDMINALANSLGCVACINKSGDSLACPVCAVCAIVGGSQSMVANISVTTNQDADVSASFKTALENTMSNYKDTKSDAVSQFFKAVNVGGTDKSWVENNVTNIIAPKITASVMNEAITQVNLSQRMSQSGSGNLQVGCTQNMSIQLIADYVQHNSATGDACATIANNVENKIKEDNSTIGQLASAFANVAIVIYLVIGVVVVVVAVVLIIGAPKILKSTKGIKVNKEGFSNEERAGTAVAA